MFRKFFRFFTTSSPHQQPQTSVVGSPNLTQELTHINQEMYKKSLELSETNKTLTILRKIDEIILSTITDPQQVAQRATSILATETEFKVVAIYMFDRRWQTLKRLALSESFPTTPDGKPKVLIPYIGSIPFTSIDNIAIQAVTERTAKYEDSLRSLLLPSLTPEHVKEIQNASGIKSIIVYPFVVRNEVIGAITVCANDYEKNLSAYTRNLLSRLCEIIGIAIDNALLFESVNTTRKQLSYANTKLQEIDLLKTEFVSLASHELRTPMTAIKSYLWLALTGRGGALTEKQKFYIDRAYNSADRLINLVNDMLNISRIESGRITLSVKPVQLEVLIREVLDELMPRAQELSISLSLLSSEPLPRVLVDTDKIKEVFINLIGNSFKFTPKGGSITISLSRVTNYVYIKIIDTGSGIALEDMPKLFEKFGFIQGSYTVNQSANSGTGLGLYIVKSIVDLHKGRITAASEGRGKGATFTFSLRTYSDADLTQFQVEAAATKHPAPLIPTQI